MFVRSGTIPLSVTQFFFSHTCVMLINSPSTFRYQAQSKFTIFYSFTTTHNDFDSADPSRMQDACHIYIVNLVI